MKTYCIPVTWEMCGVYYIKAESEKAAIDIANKDTLPFGEYIEGSFKIDLDDISEEEEEA